jgi:hypothetical protein
MKMELILVLSCPTLENFLETLFVSYDHGNSIFALVK